MKTGDVILVHNYFSLIKPMSWLSAAIRFFTNSYWNHSAIILETNGLIEVVEAKGSGVYSTYWGTWVQYPRDYKIIRSTTTTIDLAKRIIENKGKKYDFWSTLLFQAIYQITGIYIGRKGKGSEYRLNCSEFVGLVYKELYVDNYWKLTSADIDRSGYFQEVKTPS